MLPYYALRQELENLFGQKDQKRARIFGTDDGLGGVRSQCSFRILMSGHIICLAGREQRRVSNIHFLYVQH